MNRLSQIPLRLVPLRVRATRAGRPPQVPYRSLLRVAALQQRTLLTVLVGALALLTGWTWQVVGWVGDAQARLSAAACASRWTDDCLGALEQSRQAGDGARWLQWALIAAPALLGLFLGAPLVAREFEQGTQRFAWTQSVAPTRWLRGQLLFATGAALLAGGCCAALGLWLHAAMTPAFGPALGSFTPLAYNATGPVLAAAAALAVALGAAAGVLTRRTLPAVALTLPVYAATMAALTWLRQYLVPVHSLLTHHGYDLAPDDWLLRDGVLLPGGHRIPYADCVATGCPDSAPTYEDYHTAAQLWPMQWIQTGIMLLLAIAALALAHRALRIARISFLTLPQPDTLPSAH